MVFEVRVRVVSGEELLNLFTMAVSKLILSINNGYKLIRLLQNFIVCRVRFVEIKLLFDRLVYVIFQYTNSS